jgi:hypothetical protein
VMLAQKIALETSEIRALSVAINFEPRPKINDGNLARLLARRLARSSSVPLRRTRSGRIYSVTPASSGCRAWSQSIEIELIAAGDQSTESRSRAASIRQ